MALGDSSEVHYQEHTAVDLLGLDHVALSVADPGAMAAFLCDHLGMREVARTGDCMRVGAGDGATDVTLGPVDGPREPGALGRLVLRVGNLQQAVARLPSDVEVEEDAPDLVTFEGPEGLRLGFAMMAGGGIDYDVDAVVLHVADPEETRVALAELGGVPRGESLHVADKHITLEELPGFTDRPLLDHIALRVGSVETIATQARRRGLQIDEGSPDEGFRIVLPGAEQIRLYFVEPRTDE